MTDLAALRFAATPPIDDASASARDRGGRRIRRLHAGKPRVGIAAGLLAWPLPRAGRQASTVRALLAPHVVLVPLDTLHAHSVEASRLDDDQALALGDGEDEPHDALPDRLRSWRRARARAMVRQGLAGYVARAPMPARRRRVSTAPSRPDPLACALIGALPSLPLITADRLRHPVHRAAFLRRVRAYHRVILGER